MRIISWGILFTITSNDIHKQNIDDKIFGVDERLCAMFLRCRQFNSNNHEMKWNDCTSENFLYHRKVFIQFELMTLEY